jgi:hypothetical protein
MFVERWAEDATYFCWHHVSCGGDSARRQLCVLAAACIMVYCPAPAETAGLCTWQLLFLI